MNAQEERHLRVVGVLKVRRRIEKSLCLSLVMRRN